MKNQTYSATATVTPHFSSIQPAILQNRCVPCHKSGDKDFSSYSGTLKEVTPGDPSGSNLYKVVSEGKMPVDLPMLSDDEILAIYQWIENGAAND